MKKWKGEEIELAEDNFSYGCLEDHKTGEGSIYYIGEDDCELTDFLKEIGWVDDDNNVKIPKGEEFEILDRNHPMCWEMESMKYHLILHVYHGFTTDMRDETDKIKVSIMN